MQHPDPDRPRFRIRDPRPANPANPANPAVQLFDRERRRSYVSDCRRPAVRVRVPESAGRPVFRVGVRDPRPDSGRFPAADLRPTADHAADGHRSEPRRFVDGLHV